MLVDLHYLRMLIEKVDDVRRLFHISVLPKTIEQGDKEFVILWIIKSQSIGFSDQFFRGLQLDNIELSCFCEIITPDLRIYFVFHLKYIS